MNENYKKYADLLINRCLSVKPKQPLLISAPIECIDFVRVVATTALETGVKDIHFDLTDDVLKHEELKYLSNEELTNSKLFNKSIFDEYAKKDAAFLMLYGDDPDIMSDIDKVKIAYTGKLFRTSRPLYKERQLKYEVPWCIASVATEGWAKKVLPNSKTPKEDLWNLIFEMCLVNTPNPIEAWNKKIEINKLFTEKMNSLKIKKLIYKNKLGTNFEIGFTDNIWCGAGGHSTEEMPIIVNMPSEEIFTSPNKYTANGIVYASKPLVYNSSLINNFWLKFENGKVIDYDAEVGKEILKSILEIENGNYLGEVALVDVNSPISKSGVLFYETLYDENASCHLALGEGFLECIKSDKTLDEVGINKSKTHVDFMIGTDDLEVFAETEDKKLVKIIENGSFKI